jgi:hypothetical protein
MAQDNTLARSLHGRGAVLLAGNKGRLATQRGVAGATVAKAALTGLALGATAYSRALGERLMQAGDAPVARDQRAAAGAAEPASGAGSGRYGPGGWRTAEGPVNQLRHDAPHGFASCAARAGVTFSSAPAELRSLTPVGGPRGRTSCRAEGAGRVILVIHRRHGR